MEATPQNDREFEVWEHGRRQGIREGMRAATAQQATMGCICPPGANVSCEAPICPRKPIPPAIQPR